MIYETLTGEQLRGFCLIMVCLSSDGPHLNYLFTLMLAGWGVLITRNQHLDMAYFWVQIFYYGFLSINPWFHNLPPKLSTRLLLMQQLNCFGFNHCLENLMCLNKPLVSHRFTHLRSSHQHWDCRGELQHLQLMIIFSTMHLLISTNLSKMITQLFELISTCG